jgi:hypothetical protein
MAIIGKHHTFILHKIVWERATGVLKVKKNIRPQTYVDYCGGTRDNAFLWLCRQVYRCVIGSYTG